MSISPERLTMAPVIDVRIYSIPPGEPDDVSSEDEGGGQGQ
jgi:hypothetical protein